MDAIVANVFTLTSRTANEADMLCGSLPYRSKCPKASWNWSGVEGSYHDLLNEGPLHEVQRSRAQGEEAPHVTQRPTLACL